MNKIPEPDLTEFAYDEKDLYRDNPLVQTLLPTSADESLIIQQIVDRAVQEERERIARWIESQVYQFELPTSASAILSVARAIHRGKDK